MPKLTKRFIDGLEPCPAQKDQTHWDDALRGFGVRVRATGAMSWIIMYRNRDGRLRKYTIGNVGALTPDEARDEARQKLADAHRGMDPSADKGAQRVAMTVAALCDQYQEYSKERIKASTWSMDQSRIDCHVKPLLGSRKVASLKLADMESLQRDVASGKSTTTAKRKGRGGNTRGGRGVAVRTVSMMGTILEYARRQGIVTTNVARGVQKYAVGKRTRFLSYEEIAELGKILNIAADHGENRTALAAIKALALTGCRRQEILDLPWEWLDGQRSCIRFEDTKTGAQLRPIGEAAITHLLNQPKLENCNRIFPASTGEGSFVGAPLIFQRICTAANIEGVSLHTLRHTFASVAADLGYSELTIAGLLGHRGSSVTARYAHVPDRALISAADHVSNQISRALDGEATVVQFKIKATV
jgi:integrase